MKMKRFKGIFMFFEVLALLVCSLPMSAIAAEHTLSIATKEEFIAFAKSCKLDTFSKDLQVELTQDIDLFGCDITVPIFGGSFDGNGHSIRGIRMETKGSREGLFRVVTEGAAIYDLTITVEISGVDNASDIGGLCGTNSGIIQNCKVYGTVYGYKNVGGIAGSNSNTGNIEKCLSFAEINGTYKSGGITGVNSGVVTACQNNGGINLQANESATSIGGIAGVNEGVITDCKNTVDIGYLHTGYNVGGIAGLSVGFLKNCTNSGKILGRRDIGGIAGQMEPSIQLEYAQNAMELLDTNVSDFSANLNQTISGLQTAVNNGATGLGGVLSSLTNFSQSLTTDVNTLFHEMTWVTDSKVYLDQITKEVQYISDNLPDSSAASGVTAEIQEILSRFDENDPSAWSSLMQELFEKLSELSSSLTGYEWIGDSLERISASFGNFGKAVTDGFLQFGNDSTFVLENASSQLSQIATGANTFLESTGDALGQLRLDVEKMTNSISDLQVSVEDVLDGKVDTNKDVSQDVGSQENGMLVFCGNSGNISGDYNVGGVVGNVSIELGLDQEKEPLPSMEELLFTDSTTYVRATIYSCDNYGNVKAEYNYAGGIIGYGNRGVALQDQNGGNIAAGENYAGGIAGSYSGSIRDSYSLGKIEALSYIGGIAGEVKFVNSCASIPQVDADCAFAGAIAGNLTGTGEANIFVSETVGGIDNISYDGIAAPVSYKELLRQTDSPKVFTRLAVCFEVDGEQIERKEIDYGKEIAVLPSVERKEGMYWAWDAFDANSVKFNQIVSGQWHNLLTTLPSGEEMPVFLVEGLFDDNVKLSISENTGVQDKYPQLEVLSSYSLSLNSEDTKKIIVRYLSDTDGKMYLAHSAGLQAVNYRRDGRYIVFEMENGGAFVYAADPSISESQYLSIAVGLILLFSLCSVLIYRYKRKKGKGKQL